MASKDYFGFLHSPTKYAPSYEESIRDMEANSFGDLENTKDSPFHTREIYNAMDSFSRTQDLRNKYNFLEKYFEEDEKPFTSLTEQEIAQVSTLLGSDITQPAQIRQLATLAQKDKQTKDKNRPDGAEDYLVTGVKAGADTIARGVAKLPGQIAGIFGRSSTLHKEDVINAREEQEANPDKVVYDPSFGIGSFNREDKTIAEKAGEIGEDFNEKIDEKFNDSFLRVKPGESELAAMIGGGAGSLVASLVATAATKKPTYVAAAFGIQQASDTMIRAEEAGKSVEQAYLTGIGAGVTEAALEKVGLDLFFKNPATSFIKATALKSITEGTQEGLQSLSSNAWNNINDKNQGFLDGVVESALLGGLLGGVAGAPMTLAQQQKVTTEGLKLGMTKEQVAGLLDSVIPKLSDKINAGFKAVTGQEILQGNRYSRYVTQEELAQIDERGYLEVGSDGIINPNKEAEVKGLDKKHLFKLEFTPDIREMITEEGKVHSQVAVDQIPVEYISKTVTPKQQAVDAKQLEESTETAEVSEEVAESSEAEGTSVLAFKGADGKRYTTTITQAEQEYLNNETANIPSGDQNTPQLHLDAKTVQQSKSGAQSISRDEFIKMHPQAGGVLKSAAESKPKVAAKKQPTFKGGKPIFKQKQEQAEATEEDAVPAIKAFGKTIEMTEENGYEAVDTADGGKIYKKTSMTGTNKKGDKSAVTKYYTAEGKKITQEQADAYINGELKTPTLETKRVAPAEPEPPVVTETKTAKDTNVKPGFQKVENNKTGKQVIEPATKEAKVAKAKKDGQEVLDDLIDQKIAEIELEQENGHNDSDLLKEIKGLGGISGKYDSQVPITVRRKTGQSADEIVSELNGKGFNFADEQDLLERLDEIYKNGVDPKLSKKAMRERAIEELKTGSDDLANMYNETSQMVDETVQQVEAGKDVEYDFSEVATGVSKLAQGVRKNAIKNKVIYGFDKTFNELPEYEKVDVKSQQEAALDLVTSDPDLAFRIAMGQEQPTGGLLPESVFMAVENLAITNKDVETLRALATQSNLTGEASAMGQRIRMLAERNTDTPVGAIQKVEAAREKAAKKRGIKSISRTRKTEVAKLKAEIKKKNTVKKETLQEFINGLEC